MAKPGRKPLPKGQRKQAKNISLSPEVAAHLDTKNNASAYIEALIREDVMGTQSWTWTEGDPTGNGAADLWGYRPETLIALGEKWAAEAATIPTGWHEEGRERKGIRRIIEIAVNPAREDLDEVEEIEGMLMRHMGMDNPATWITSAHKYLMWAKLGMRCPEIPFVFDIPPGDVPPHKYQDLHANVTCVYDWLQRAKKEAGL